MNLRTETKIGLIVLSTIAILIWGINFLKGKNVLKRTDVYYAVYDDVAGLKKSSLVIMSGFKIGQINNIDFVNNRLDKVIVAIVINKKYKIPKKSKAEIYNSDILGNKVIRIIPSGEKEIYSYGDTLIGSLDPDIFTKIQNQIGPLVESGTLTVSKIDSLVTSINEVFNTDTQRKLRSSVSNLESVSGALKNQLSPNGQMELTLKNLQAFSKMLSDNKETLSNAFSNIENISDSIANANLHQAINEINSTFYQSRILLEKVNNGEGSLGLAATNDSLYNNLVKVSSTLNNLLEDLNKHPKRYVHFSVFGKKEKQN